MKITLASTAKHKSDLLAKAGIKHSTIKSDFEEMSENRGDAHTYVQDLALGKAVSVQNKVKDGIIIGLDTIVCINNKIYEKPKTIEEAKEAIRKSANNTSSVITGIALINQETHEIITDYAESKVTLREIDEEDINYYIENEPRVMYAAGYIIETIISNFIENIEGSFYNIIGVPVETIYKHIHAMGYNLKDLEE